MKYSPAICDSTTTKKCACPAEYTLITTGTKDSYDNAGYLNEKVIYYSCLKN